MSELRIAFVGSVVPEDDCTLNPICNAAGNKFQRNFIAALRSAAGRPIDVITFIPAAMFPSGRKIVYRRREVDIDEGMQPASFIAFLNLPVLKQATQALSILLALARWHRKNRKQARAVIVYNVFAAHSIPVLLARAFFGGRALALIADMPHGIYEFSGIWGVLERAEIFAQTRSIARFDGQIALTEMIMRDFAPSVPGLLLEGGVDQREAAADPPGREASDVRTLVFSGTLNEINGTRLMLDAFALLEGTNYRLRIFGRGPIDHLAAEAALRDPRIDFQGFRPNAEIVREQRLATLLLNPRPTAHAITRYSFPSKLLEYMLSGRPVITTRLAGIPSDYFPHLLILDEDSPERLASLIRETCERPTAELDEFGARSREFVLRHKTWEKQGARVYDFVRGLEGAR